MVSTTEKRNGVEGSRKSFFEGVKTSERAGRILGVDDEVGIVKKEPVVVGRAADEAFDVVDDRRKVLKERKLRD